MGPVWHFRHSGGHDGLEQRWRADGHPGTMLPLHPYYLSHIGVSMRWLKRIGYAAGALIGIVIVAFGAVYAMSEIRFRRTYVVPEENVVVSDDSATPARGAHPAARAASAAARG